MRTRPCTSSSSPCPTASTWCWTTAATSGASTSDSYYGLYVCPMMWRELDNISSGSVCMVLASNRYAEDDDYRDYDAFRAALGMG